MTTFDTLSEEQREAVCAALAEHLGDYWRRRWRERKGELPPEPRFTLHESMRLSVMDLPREPDPASDVERYERSGERWHHQIHVDGEPRLYARTLARADREQPTVVRHQLVEIGNSAVVPEITRVLTELDEAGEEDASGVVRLFVAPSRAFHALAILRQGRLSEVIRLSATPEQQRRLAKEDPVTRGEDLPALLATLPSAYGIGDDTETPAGKEAE